MTSGRFYGLAIIGRDGGDGHSCLTAYGGVGHAVSAPLAADMRTKVLLAGWPAASGGYGAGDPPIEEKGNNDDEL